MKLKPYFIHSLDENNKSFHWRRKYINWINSDIYPQLIYSYRSTHYTQQTFPRRVHFHDYYELVIVESGSIRYTCEDMACTPKSGDMILIPPGKLHTAMLRSEETLYIRDVFFFYPNAFTDYDAQALIHRLQELGEQQYFYSFSSSTREEILTLLHRIKDVQENASASSHILQRAYVLQLFYLLGQPSRGIQEHDSGIPPTLMEVRRYIDEHFTEITSISDISDHFFYSREHISRLFKKHMDTTATDYLNKRRIGYSCQLMQSDLSLTDICFRAGFGSVPAFIRAFKKATGLTPSQYRRQEQI